MQKLDLLPRKAFELTLDDGTVIKGKLNIWAQLRYSELLNCETVELLEAKKLKGVTSKDTAYYILACVEYYFHKEGRPFKYNDAHFWDWVEEMGGIESESFKSLLEHLGKEEPDAQKKNQENGVLNGTNSKDSPIHQD